MMYLDLEDRDAGNGKMAGHAEACQSDAAAIHAQQARHTKHAPKCLHQHHIFVSAHCLVLPATAEELLRVRLGGRQACIVPGQAASQT